MERRQQRSIPTGIFAGAVGVVLAHHLTWYFVLLLVNVQYWFFDLDIVRPLDPVLGFFGVSAFTLFSLVFYGWLTLPFGLIAGGLLARRSEPVRAAR